MYDIDVALVLTSELNWLHVYVTHKYIFCIVNTPYGLRENKGEFGVFVNRLDEGGN